MTSGHLASQRAEGDKTVSLHESPPQGLARQAIRSSKSSEPTAVRPRPALLSLRLRNEIPPLLEPRDARVARTRSHQTRFILDVVRLLNTVAVPLESELRQSACLSPSSVDLATSNASTTVNKSLRAEKVRSFDSLSSFSPSEILSLSSSRVASPPSTRPYTRAGQFIGTGSGQRLCRNQGVSCVSLHSYPMMQVTHRPAATSKGHKYQQIVLPVQNKHTQPGPITKEELDRIVKSAKEIIVAPKDMASTESVHLALHLPGDLGLSYDVSKVHPVLDRAPDLSSHSMESSSVSKDRQRDSKDSAPPPLRSRVSSRDKEVPLVLDTRQYFEQANAHLFHLDTPSTIELFGEVSPAAYGDRVTQLRRRESWDAVSPLSAHNSPIQDSSSFQVSARSSINSPPSQSSSSDYRRSLIVSSDSQLEILPPTSYADSATPKLKIKEDRSHSRSVSENITSTTSIPSRTQKRMYKQGRSIMGPPHPPPTGPLPPLPEKRGLTTFFRRRSQVSLKELIIHPPQSYRLEQELESSKSTDTLSKSPEFSQLSGLNIRSSPLSSGVSTPMAKTPSQRKAEVELPPQVTQRMKKTQELRQRDISRMRGRKSANSLQTPDGTEATKTRSNTPQEPQNETVDKSATNDAQLQTMQQDVPPLRPRKDPRRMAGSDPLSISTTRLDQKISNVYDNLTGYIFPYMSTSPSKDNQRILVKDYAVSPVTPIEVTSKELSSNSSAPITPIRADHPLMRSRPKTPVGRPPGYVKEYAPLESIGAPSPPRPKTPLAGSLKSSPGSASIIASSLPQTHSFRPERIEKLEVGGTIPPPTSKRGTQSSDESLFQRIDAGDVLLMMEDLEVRITKKFEKRMRGLEQRVAVMEQLVVESITKI